MKFTCFYLPTGVQVSVGERVQCQKHIAMATFAKIFHNGKAIGYLAKSTNVKCIINGSEGFDEEFANLMPDTWTARVVDDGIIFNKRAVVLEFDVPGYVSSEKKFTAWLSKSVYPHNVEAENDDEDTVRRLQIGDKIEFSKYESSFYYAHQRYLGFIQMNYRMDWHPDTVPMTKMEYRLLPNTITATVVDIVPDFKYEGQDNWTHCVVLTIDNYDELVNGPHLFDNHYTIRWNHNETLPEWNGKLIITKTMNSTGEKNLKAQICGGKNFGFIEKDVEKIMENTIPLNQATIDAVSGVMTATVQSVKYCDDDSDVMLVKIKLDDIEY